MTLGKNTHVSSIHTVVLVLCAHMFVLAAVLFAPGAALFPHIHPFAIMHRRLVWMCCQ